MSAVPDDVTLRPLHGEPGEMRELQRVLEAAPSYAETITGAPPGPADAQSTCTILPEGKGYDDKFVFGIYRGDAMVGCIDLIRGWPRERTATLGLLLIAEPQQRQGIGRRAYALVERFAREHGCERMRIGVVRVNDAVLPFWTGLGFAATGEVKPYRYGPVESQTIVLEKALDER